MKKIILILCLIIFGANVSSAFEPDYRQIYLNMDVPKFSYMHGLDSGQYYDNKSSTWSPYPLFRLSSVLYFKSITIHPGYYLLTPTVHKGSDYLLMKENGMVRYIIPIYQKELVPEGFYEAHIPQPKLLVTQRIYKNVVNFVGTHFKRAQKKPTPASYLEVNDIDNNFVSIVVYYGPYRYYTIFRTVQL
jgi:hypothetical protein